MIGHGEKLTRNQEKAIAALISYSSIPEAAVSIGIGEATLFRWLKNPRFKAKYRRARHQVVSQAIGHLQTKITKAIDTLLEVAGDKGAPSSARVAAARVIIDQSLRAVEIGEIEARIERIENRLKEEKSK